MKKEELIKISDYIYEVPKHGGMRVPGRIFADCDMLSDIEESINQVINVAHLPGIIGYSLAMPDIHWGYGFPIGGVAATQKDGGVVSPGGIGFDINCGVRLLKTNLNQENIEKDLRMVLDSIFNNVPSGVASKNRIRVSKNSFLDMLRKGAKWAVSEGYADLDDLEYIEENGTMKGADPDLVSKRAIERGLPQLATLGSGNHFIEIDVVDEIYDEKAAKVFGISKGQIMLQVHTGSRGFGHQVCDDYVKIMIKALKKYKIEVPDAQLCCAPLDSPEAKNYRAAMACAANFAFVNRQTISFFAEEAILKTLNITKKDLGMKLIYDICHNIGKFEEHEFDGKKQEVFVHRKGATRAFGPSSNCIPNKYKDIGQPVLIPGDMGRYSFLLTGTDKAMKETFGSSCHGAGRLLSRHQALRELRGVDLIEEMDSRGVMVAVKTKKTLGEEMPIAYKDVENVVNIMDKAGISLKIAKFKPIGVIKG